MAFTNNVCTRLVVTSARDGTGQSAVSRVPQPELPESFYFNQHSVAVEVAITTTHQSLGHGLQGVTRPYRASYRHASAFVTDKRLILLQQPVKVQGQELADGAFQLDLASVTSLKFRMIKKSGVHLDIVTLDQEALAILLTFSHAGRCRRDAFKEYLNMVMAALASRRGGIACHTMALHTLPFWRRPSMNRDELPTYTEALRHPPAAPFHDQPPGYI